MTQADRVHSTPPTNTPIDTSRRRFLAQAAAVAGTGAALGMTLPLPGSAGAAEPAPDPIFAAIEECVAKKKISDARYAQVSAAYRKAREAGLEGESHRSDREAFVVSEIGCDPDDYTDETVGAWWDSADELFETQPTTLAGVIALLRHADALCDRNAPLIEQNAVPLISNLAAAFQQIAVRA